MLAHLLSPVRALSQRLYFGQKFTVIFLLAILPSLVLLGLGARGSLQDIERDTAELRGLDALKSISALVTPAGLHRGLTSRALTGDSTVQPEIDSAAQAMDSGLAVLASPQLADLPGLAEPVAALADSWKNARTWQGKSPEANFEAHTAVLADTNDLLHRAGGESGLLLDPEAKAYFEIVTLVDQIPKLTEQIAQTRGGLSMLHGSDQEVDVAVRQIIMRLEQTSTTMRRIDTDLHLLGEDSPDTLKAIQPDWQAIQSSVHGLSIGLAAAGGQGAAQMKAHKADYFEQISTVLTSIQRFEDAQFTLLRTEVLGARLANERRAFALQLAAGAGLLSVVAWLVLGFARDMTSRISEVQAAVGRLGAGDFTERLEERGADQISVIARSLNQMSSSLGRLLTAIQTDAAEVLASATAISGASSQVASAADEQALTATHMAATVQELGVSIGQIAESAAEANDLAQSAGHAAQGGGQVIGDTVARVRNIAAKVEAASGTVSHLGEQAATISGIAEVIQGIADQTNLLALNAAIEAARAGEMGRGFAVVADEVRRLAERTSTATHEIVIMIENIQGGTRRAVEGMAAGVAEVQSGVLMAERAGSAIATIEATSIQVIDVASAISANLTSQSALARDVTERVGSIAKTSGQYSAAAASTAEASDQLRTLATGLERRLSAFRFHQGH